MQMQYIGLLNGWMEIEVSAILSGGELKSYRGVAFVRQEVQSFGHKSPKCRLLGQKIIGQIEHSRCWPVFFESIGYTYEHRALNAVRCPYLFLQGSVEPVSRYSRPAK